jgi:hypothetical protein
MRCDLACFVFLYDHAERCLRGGFGVPKKCGRKGGTSLAQWMFPPALQGVPTTIDRCSRQRRVDIVTYGLKKGAKASSFSIAAEV